jgi:GNAT superfamily N-acetyltransferase
VSRVRVRELGPGDGDVLDAVFAGLSAQSRYLRFHSPLPRLDGSVRHSLTAIDGRDHIALGAFADGRPIGIVRIVSVGEGRAELAVEVVDAWQRNGVGTRLLRAARERAAQLGHRELVAEVLAENAAMLTVLRRVFRIARTAFAGAELTITMPVADEFGLAGPIDDLAA